MSILKAVRGTRDLLPPETEIWSHIETAARNIFARYHFGEIRTPIFEDTQLFARGVGEETDIVSKEMYTWEDRARAQSEKAQSLTLRPENTAGVVRAYIEHGLGDTGLLQKLFYIGPQFRRERPQKGRYRQFFQIGAEVIGPPSSGSESPLRDAEVLEMLASLLDALGITGWKLLINSVGSKQDRPKYIETLRAALAPVVGQMCVDCQRRAVTNPLRVLDCKVPEDQPIIETLPKIWDSLDEDSRAHFAQVCAALDACGVPYEHNQRLVRGLDYYTRTTFEFTHGGLGAQNALLGGGRYDGLSELIGGPNAPGIGFAMGEDRLVLTLLAQQEAGAQVKLADVYIAPLGEKLNAPALALARELRREGLRVELGDGSFKLKKSFEMGNKLAHAILLFGEDETSSGVMTVKDFATGEQKKVPRAELTQFFRTLKEFSTQTSREDSALTANEEDAKKLLREIACCPIAREQVERPDPGHPCSQVVTIQGADYWKSFQVPEPWSGHLLKAPILFLSSNPSISDKEAFPRGAGDLDLWSFFESRFDGKWVKDGIYPLNADLKTYGPAVKYWANILGRATELLGAEANPGRDYALSEMVHCKSKNEVGVESALSTCAERYLMRLLSCSSAVVIVLVGKKALGYWNSLRALPPVPLRDGTELFEIAGRKRVVVFLPAPAGFGPKKFADCLSSKRIDEIRALLSDQKR